MTPERWRRVDELFHSALEREPAERGDFLRESCSGDEVLRREVEKLIAAHEKDGSFIDSPAYADTELFIDRQDVLTAGQRLGPYKVISHIGSGGMGQVFLSQDNRLNRRVALKLLRSDLTGNEDRLRRFQQEAQAVSALNHPNILTIHEIGQQESLLYIATEYKNIMVRTDGYVKVLDFGLAKLAESKPLESIAPTLPMVKTEPGLVMGTVTYMSPEQARGLSVDERTDIFSLGAVIYEMTSGHQPFEAKTASDVMALILQKKPLPLAHFLPELPAEVDRIVRKAPRKDREERYQTTKDLLIDLKNLRKELELEAERERSVRPATAPPTSSP